MEEPENEDVCVCNLVSQQVIPHAELANIARSISFDARPAPREIKQCFRCRNQPIEDPIGCVEIVLCKEFIKPIDVRLGGE